MAESYRPTFAGYNTRMVNYKTVAGAAATTNIDVTNLDGSDIDTKAIILSAKVVVPSTYKANLKTTVVAGTTATTNIAVSGIATSDILRRVLMFAAGVPSDVTAEASITTAGNIQLATTNSTGNTLVVEWNDVSLLPVNVDITDQVSVTTKGHIQVSTDATTGFNIDLIWLDPTASERPYVTV